MAFIASLFNSAARFQVGEHLFAFAAIGQTLAGDSYLTASKINMRDATVVRVNLLRRIIGARNILGIFTSGLMSDHLANGHTLIVTGAFDMRFDYLSQLITYYQSGRSSAPAAIASEVELANDSSINCQSSRRPVLVIAENGGATSDCETLS